MCIRDSLKGKGEAASAIVGFVRIPAGTAFIEHEHLGPEKVFVLQGRFKDGDTEYGPGDLATMPAGSSHSFDVLPGAPLVYLLVLHGGLRIGEHVIRPGSHGL